MLQKHTPLFLLAALSSLLLSLALGLGGKDTKAAPPPTSAPSTLPSKTSAPSTSSGLTTTPAPVYPTFRAVMQSLQSKMHLVATGIFNEDFDLIERTSWQIAKHQGPPLAERQRVLAAVGKKLPFFRAFDRQVHSNAALMSKAARARRIGDILHSYQAVVAGCVSCHALVRPLLTAPASRPTPR